jgi:membrane-associated phospholipid phosphatase
MRDTSSESPAVNPVPEPLWNRPHLFQMAWLWLGTLCLLLVFGRLTTPPLALDLRILGQLAAARTAFWDGFFTIVSWAGSLILLAPLTAWGVVRLRRQRRWRDAQRLALSLGGVVVGVYLAKALWARPRPELFPFLIPPPLGLSYPSAHAAQIAAVVTAAFFIRPGPGGRFRPLLLGLAVLLAVAVAVSRVYLQVHYPSDVLGGAAYAVYWVLALEGTLRAMNHPTRSRKNAE